ncbi:DEAD/DEAH box helicase [Nocardiopsis listeri]|uniref:DEAD/DEAH box helicase n=1 Tax=Nocardiopsis listeri TaxID=53440 RepID=UPI00082C859A|nr:DEAD/DEAH box helicase [Nocardiopsis listeri]
MRTIEAFWEADRLRVWGLDSTLSATTRSQERIRPHPYALDGHGLAECLSSSPPLRPRHGEAVLHLPGIPRHPVPPPDLPVMRAAPPFRLTQVTVRPWRVPTLDLSGGDVLTLLRHLDVLPRSRSLRVLAELLATGVALVDARRVIPRLVAEHVPQEGPSSAPELHARWRPLLDAITLAWLREHVRGLPPVARAHHTPDLTPNEAGADAMADALGALCALTDLVARERLTEHRPNLPAHQRLQHRWLEALTEADSALEDPAPIPGSAPDRFAEELHTWFTAAHRYAGAVRLVFRLVEPVPEPSGEIDGEPVDDLEEAVGEPTEESEEVDVHADIGASGGLYIPVDQPWRLRILVQSVEEPSLMIPLSDLRAGEGTDRLPPATSPALTRELERAAHTCPLLNPEHESPEPADLELFTEEAGDFLTRHAEALRAAGFGVLLPPWIGEVGMSVKLALSEHEPRPFTTGASDGSTLIDFDHRLALGESDLTAEELAELARLKRPLIRLRGEWARFDPERLRRAASLITRKGQGTVRVGEALRMALIPGPDQDLPVEVEATGDLGALLDGRAERVFTPMTEPPGLVGRLRPYQRRGAGWLRYLDRLGLGAVLADDMGLGKTIQLLALLADERAADEVPAPTLMVCPTSVVGNWCREVERFTPKLRVLVHHGPGRYRGETLAKALTDVDLVVTTYGVAVRDAAELGQATWARVVCDEAQHIKNSHTKQAEAVRAIPAASRIALTGTPVENHLGELWSILDFANPGLLGSRERFEKGVVDLHRDPTRDTGKAAAERLRRVTAPFVLRRLKTDRSIIEDLPAKHQMRVWCTLTPEQASLYKAVVEEMTELVDEATGLRRKSLILATMTKLKQVCNHPAHLLGDGSRLAGRSGKLARLEQLLAEMVAGGDKVLCFTQYTEFGTRLAPYLEGKLDVPVLWLHGGIPRRRREEMIERFQVHDGPMVFLLSLRAGGTGLNLTAAHQVVHIDRWWNPAVEDQATDRAYRIGQRRDVQVRKMICAGTLEERVDQMLERKKQLAEAAVGSGESPLTDMSVEQLRETIRLAPEAVA